jgi:hypothetical protein
MVYKSEIIEISVGVWLYGPSDRTEVASYVDDSFLAYLPVQVLMMPQQFGQIRTFVLFRVLTWKAC